MTLGELRRGLLVTQSDIANRLGMATADVATLEAAGYYTVKVSMGSRARELVVSVSRDALQVPAAKAMEKIDVGNSIMDW